MAVVGTLEIQMMANMARLQKDMKQAKGMVGSTMKGIQSSVNLAKQALGALGLGLGVRYFARFITGAVDMMDRLDDLRLTTKLTVEELSGIGYAAKLSGSELETTASAINKLGMNIGKETDKFHALGITAKSPIEAFKQLSDIFRAIEDPQQRAAVAALALGKSWEGAAPLLSAGSTKIQEMINKGAKLSNITGDMAMSASDLNDKMDETKAIVTGLSNNFIAALLPSLNETLKSMNEMISSGNKLQGILRGMIGIAKLPFDFFSPTADLKKTLSYVGQIKEQEEKIAAIERAVAGGWGETKTARLKKELDLQLSILETMKKHAAELDKSIKPKQSEADAKAAEEAARKAEQFILAQAAQKGAYETLVKQIETYNETMKYQIVNAGQMTQTEKMALTIKQKLSKTQQEQIAGAFQKLQADEAAYLAMKQFENLEKNALSRRVDMLTVMDQNKQSIIDGNINMRQSTEEIGLSADALTALKIARVDDTIAIEQRKLAILETSGFETEEVIKIRETIAALEDRKQVITGAASANMRNDISTQITAGIMEGFEDGKTYPEIFQNMTKQMFKDMVLEPQIKAAVTAGVDWVRELLISSTTTSANTTSIVTLTAAVNANTAAQGTSSGASAVGGAAGSSGSAWSGLVTVGAYVAIAYLVKSFFDRYSYTSSGIAGSIDNGGVNAKGWRSEYNSPSFVGALFGARDSYTKTYFDLTAEQLGGLNKAFDAVRNTVEEFADQLKISTEALKNYSTTFDISGTSESINQLFRRVGDEMTYAVLGVDTSIADKKYAGRIEEAQKIVDEMRLAMRIKLFGNQYIDYGERKALEEAVAAVEKIKAEKAQFVTSMLPEWFQQLQIAGESVSTTLQRVGNEIRTVDGIWKTLGYDTKISFGELGEGLDAINASSIKAREALIAQAGGMDALVKREMEFYNIAYTQEERDANTLQAAKETIDALFAELGLAVPDSMVAFRELRGSLDLTTQYGLDAYAALTDAASTFAIIAKAAEEANKELDETADKIAELFDQDTFSTMIDYKRAVGRAINSSILENSKVSGFANGGTFTNKLFSSPTPFMFANGGGFSPGVMGEKGTEAVMPLGRSRTGQLGVHVLSNPNDNNIVSELRALRAEVLSLRISADSAARSSQKTTDILRNVTQDGNSLLTTAA